jgi:hypothetical protein
LWHSLPFASAIQVNPETRAILNRFALDT